MVHDISVPLSCGVSYALCFHANTMKSRVIKFLASDGLFLRLYLYKEKTGKSYGSICRAALHEYLQKNGM